MKNIFIAFTIAACIAVASCNKLENSDRAAKLNAHSWQLVDKVVNGSSVDLQDCEKQETWIFKASNGYVVAGATRCSTDIETSDTVLHFYWDVEGNQLLMNIKQFGSPSNNPDWYINKLDDNTFIAEERGHGISTDSGYTVDRTFRAIN